MSTIANVVADFGADPTGTTDSTAAFNNAIGSGKGTIYVPAGLYIIGPLNNLNNAQQIVGDGIGRSIIRQNTPISSGGLINGIGVSDIRIKDLTIDGQLQAGTGVALINLNETNRVIIDGVCFLNFTVFAISLNFSMYFKVINCHFDRSASSISQNQAIVVSSSSGQSGYGRISQNTMLNSGMDISAVFTIISENIIDTLGFGGGITTEQDPDSAYMTIIGNICLNAGSLGPDDNATVGSGIENWAPYSIIANNRLSANYGDGLDQGGAFSLVSCNHIQGNGKYGSRDWFGIAARYGTSSYNGASSAYLGNYVIAINGEEDTQKLGIGEQILSGESQTRLYAMRYVANIVVQHPGGTTYSGTNYSISSPYPAFSALSYRAVGTITLPALAAGAIAEEAITVGNTEANDLSVSAVNGAPATVLWGALATAANVITLRVGNIGSASTIATPVAIIARSDQSPD